MLTKDFWKKYFTVYDKLNELQPYQELLSKIVEILEIHPGDLVLDAGAGTGNLALEIEKSGARIVGFDSSDEGLQLFREKLPRQDSIVGDLTKSLPFPENYFDKICTSNTIYTLPPESRPGVFKEFYRVLKPAGIIVSSNIKSPFKPLDIYLHHIRWSFQNNGVFITLLKILRFLGPTVLIFRYNALIKREHVGGIYRFFESREQHTLLQQAGFVDISDDTIIYAGQAVLNQGRKPSMKA